MAGTVLPGHFRDVTRLTYFSEMTQRHWCYTLNNPTLTPEGLLKILDEDPRVRYAIFQEEKGDNETPHYQGYVELSNSQRLAAMRKMIPGAHWESRRGTRDQARDYCRKEDSRINGPWECGEFPSKQGARADLLDAVTTAQENWSIAQVALEHPVTFVKYNRGLSAYIFNARPARSIANPPSVHLYFGPTGTGKTRKAYEENPDLFRKAPDSFWFDGYHGQSTLLLDDYSGAASKMSLNYMLQLLDRYPIDVQVKGGYAKMTARHIVLTTNLHPSVWFNYAKRESQYIALQRRFTSIYVFKGKISIKVTHKAFFEDWFDDCDEDRLFWTHADTEAIELSDDEEELSEVFSAGEDPMPLGQPSSSDECWLAGKLFSCE